MHITILSLWAHKLFDPQETLPYGGAELQLVTLAKTWTQYPNTRITFVTRGHGSKEYLSKFGIEIIKLPFHESATIRSTRGIYEILKELSSIPSDILIQRGGGIETGLAGYISRRKKIPLLFMCSSALDVDGTHARGRGKIYGFFYQYGLKQATHVVVQNEYQKTQLQQHNIESTLIRSSQEIPESIPSQKKGILWVG
ncbi:hypothetical protein GF373_12090, partial [bacterium]|nr:hypothetical protein [bacterium]